MRAKLGAIAPSNGIFIICRSLQFARGATIAERSRLGGLRISKMKPDRSGPSMMRAHGAVNHNR